MSYYEEYMISMEELKKKVDLPHDEFVIELNKAMALLDLYNKERQEENRKFLRRYRIVMNGIPILTGISIGIIFRCIK